jgi:hypothetical protein
MENKVCRSCGVDRPITEYRHYYGGRKGYYKICKQCESIEQRRKYLVGKELLTEQEHQDLANIRKLYENRSAKGLKPPVPRGTNGGVSSLISSLLEAEVDGV